MSKILTLAISLILILPCSILSGVISDDLQNTIEISNPDQPIKVWIKLYTVESSKNLKKSLATFSTRKERHSLALASIKSAHEQSQGNLKNYLNSVIKSSRKNSIKQRWIANIIEAELTASEINSVAARSDVELILSEPQIRSIAPTLAKDIPTKEAVGIEPNLQAINAPAAWAAGYKGQGSLVCTFDTGVQQAHPALYNQWKGLDGDTTAAWFDPARFNPYPVQIQNCDVGSCLPQHGTHVMGIILGNDGTDTIGVAPEAKWISAAVIDVSGASILDGFEWAADPDGDPNTIDDVPDVINHSWGMGDLTCENVFYDVIDNMEALGIVNIFSAGNEGPNPSTLRNPADRALDSHDMFAVGNIEHLGDTIVTSSSRGPSLCTNGNIKPNVVAPGYLIRSAWNSSAYNSLSGTSMSAPHVTGLVALLRGKNPNATVDEIKEAILTTANNSGTPNNTYGWGKINCLAALNALSTTNSNPNIRVYSYDHAPIAAGDIVEGTLVLKNNMNANALNVTANVVDNNTALTVISGGSMSFGTINQNSTGSAGSLLRVEVADTTSPGTILSLDLTITASSPFYVDNTAKIYFVVDPPQVQSSLDHNVNNIQFTVSNYGNYGLGANSFMPLGGLGFDYMSGGNDLWEMDLMIGLAGPTVSDAAQNKAVEPDKDFRVAPDGNLVYAVSDPGVQRTRSIFDDSKAETPIGLKIKQSTYAFNYNPYRDFIIMEYIITNTSGGTLNPLYVGLLADWDVYINTQNAGGYDATDEFSWVAYSVGVGPTLSDFRGIKVLNKATATSYTDSIGSLYSAGSGDFFTEQEKFNVLSDGLGSAATFNASKEDLLQVTSAALNLGVGETDTVAFAILAGDNLTAIKNAANQAVAAYNGMVTDIIVIDDPTGLPTSYSLSQNYPNPFNPSTVIKFNLPSAGEYSLAIYNITGQKVEEFSGYSSAGEVTVEWDATGFSSGIYLYKLTTDKYTSSKKMVLMK